MRLTRLFRENIALRDGRKVVLRPIDPSDAPRLIDLHDSLSFESQFFRFFGPKPKLTPAEADYLANVDFHKRFAIVGVTEEDGNESIVGVGRFDINEPRVAEAAIVVRDDYQHLGLGTAILQRMRDVGRGAGLDAFTAEVLAENARMLELLGAQGLTVEPASGGIVRVKAPLELPVLLRTLKVGAQITEAIIERLPRPPGRSA